MKRAIVIALISVFALSVAAPAPAAGPTVKSLSRQIKALQKDVKKLKADVQEARGAAATAIVYGGCVTAVTVDALQGTWTRLDAQFGQPVFGPQTPVSDFDTCRLIRITRQPTQSPPNVSVFSSLLVLFQ